MDTLHPLLGTDKANPLIELLVDRSVPDKVFVHFGMRLLEVVRRGRDSVEEKLLAGRLYNAGFKRRALVAAFGRDRHTIQGYGEALRSGDAERLRRSLAGQGSEPKVEAVHEHFIRATFREQHACRGCHINRFIREELSEKLKLEVSYETVRLITVDEGRRLAASSVAEGSGSDRCAVGFGAADAACGNDASPEPSGGDVQERSAAVQGLDSAAGEHQCGGAEKSEVCEAPALVTLPGSAAVVAVVGPVADRLNAGAMAPLPSQAVSTCREPERAGSAAAEVGAPPTSVRAPDPPAVVAGADGVPAGENACENQPFSSTTVEEKSKHSPSSLRPSACSGHRGGAGGPLWFPHAGLLLVRPGIEALTASLELVLGGVVRHWLGTVLCGAVNLEQTKELDHEAVSAATGGKCPKGRKRQREFLHALADAETVNALRGAHLQWLVPSGQDTFYYDPHGIEYTGEEKFLRGWLGCAHKVAKVYYLDMVHLPDGSPLVAFPDDNYMDARKRFPRHAGQLRALLGCGPERFLTFVADRALYDLEDMLQGRLAHIHLITWEKGVKEPPWDPPRQDTVSCFHLVRRRNKFEDTITCRVEAYRESWRREPSISRFVVRITKPGPEPLSVTVPVLCTDPQRDAEQAVRPLLRRWLQENDILYLVRNFGINQITTYKTVSYAKIAEQIEELAETTPVHRRLCAEKAELKQRWGRELVKQEQVRLRLQTLEQQIGARLRTIDQELAGASEPQRGPLRKERDRLKRSLSQKRRGAEMARQNRETAVDGLKARLTAIERDLEQTPEQASRLERLIAEQYQRLAFAPKAFLDAIRIMSRNLFASLHKVVRPARNNYRDDHVLVRDLLRAPAWLERVHGKLVVRLILHGHRSVTDRVVVRRLLDQMNEQSRLFDPSGAPLKFELAEPAAPSGPFRCSDRSEGT